MTLVSKQHIRTLLGAGVSRFDYQKTKQAQIAAPQPEYLRELNEQIALGRIRVVRIELGPCGQGYNIVTEPLNQFRPPVMGEGN